MDARLLRISTRLASLSLLSLHSTIRRVQSVRCWSRTSTTTARASAAGRASQGSTDRHVLAAGPAYSSKGHARLHERAWKQCSLPCNKPTTCTKPDWIDWTTNRRSRQQGQARASSHHPSVRWPRQRRQGGTSHRRLRVLHPQIHHSPCCLSLPCAVPGQGSSSWCSDDLSKKQKQSSRFATRNALTLHTSSVKTRSRPDEFQWVTTHGPADGQHDVRGTHYHQLVSYV